MIVPTGFRRSAATPKAVVLHPADLPPSDVEQIDGVPVTTALRALFDVASTGDVPLPDLQSAFAEAVRSGKITRAAIAAAKSDPARSGILRRLINGRR